MTQLVAELNWPEPELRALCQHGDPRLPELERFAQCLRVPPSYSLNSSFSQAGNGNT